MIPTIIQFKASSKSHHELSNLYGGAEFTYMAQRTKNPALRKLYLILSDIEMDYEQFKCYHGRLAPAKRREYKKNPNKKGHYLKHYSKGDPDSIARGILAKLISGCWRVTMKARLKVVNAIAKELLGSQYEVIHHGDFIDGSKEQKLEWMWRSLELKFSKPRYRDLLLSTGTSKLIEQSGRGKDNWSGPEGWLGRLLMQLREKLRHKNDLDNDKLTF